MTHLTLILSASRASVGFKTSTPHRPSASDTSTPNFFSNYDPTQYVETHFEKKILPLGKTLDRDQKSPYFSYNHSFMCQPGQKAATLTVHRVV